MKLEIKHLAPYFPYGLNMHNEILKNAFVRGGKKYIPSKLTRISFDGLFWVGQESGSRQISTDVHKPLLRPLSQLTQEIEHKGQRFVPMDKLFELAFNTEIKENKQYESKYDAHAIKATIDDESIVFAYWSNKKHFAAHWIEEDQVELTIVENQYDLFQKLLEWHFDVNGLIENNLAEAISE